MECVLCVLGTSEALSSKTEFINSKLAPLCKSRANSSPNGYMEGLTMKTGPMFVNLVQLTAPQHISCSAKTHTPSSDHLGTVLCPCKAVGLTY